MKKLNDIESAVAGEIELYYALIAVISNFQSLFSRRL